MILYNNTHRSAIATACLLILFILSSCGAYYSSLNDEMVNLGTIAIPWGYSYRLIHSERPISLFLICIACALFFFTTTFLSLWHFIKRSPRAIMSNNDLTIYPYPPIQWNDIQNIKIITVHGQKFIGITIKNPAHYFPQMSLWQKCLCKFNYYSFGFHLYLANLTVPLNDALNILTEYQQQNSSRHQ